MVLLDGNRTKQQTCAPSHARQAILALHSTLLLSFSAAPWIAKTDGELKSSSVLANDTRNKQVVRNGLLLQAFSISLPDRMSFDQLQQIR